MEKGRHSKSHELPIRHLPPPELWLHDPQKDGLIPTPLDRNGLVDQTELIKQTKKTVDPDYDWAWNSYNDIHHMQWPKNAYPRNPDDPADPHTFRELAISKIKLQRTLHNRLHHVTEPPPVPSPEVRLHRINSQRIIRALAANATRICDLLISDIDARAERRLIQQFDRFNELIDSSYEVPMEFHPIDLSNIRPYNVEEVLRIRSKLVQAATYTTVKPYIRGQKRKLSYNAA